MYRKLQHTSRDGTLTIMRKSQADNPARLWCPPSFVRSVTVAISCEAHQREQRETSSCNHTCSFGIIQLTRRLTSQQRRAISLLLRHGYLLLLSVLAYYRPIPATLKAASMASVQPRTLWLSLFCPCAIAGKGPRRVISCDSSILLNRGAPIDD